MRFVDCSPENIERGIIVSDEDFYWIKQYLWHLSKGYVWRNDLGFLHRKILNLTDRKILVNHKNGNPLDNRRENIRICNQEQNSRNQGKRKNTKFAYKGLSSYNSKRRGIRYCAQLCKKNKYHYSKPYKTPKEAAEEYDRLAIKHFGEFARTNKSLGLL